jgi:hypothetical protein
MVVIMIWWAAKLVSGYVLKYGFYDDLGMARQQIRRRLLMKRWSVIVVTQIDPCSSQIARERGMS